LIARRTLLIVFGAVVIAPLAALAQQPGKVWRVGFLTPLSRQAANDAGVFDAFVQGLRELGYVEGKNLVIEARFAEGRPDRLPRLARELVELNVDVIMSGGTPSTSAAQKATTTIPIVMGSVIDPIGSGFVKSLAHPGGNITGRSNFAGDVSSKYLELVLAFIPKLSLVAVLLDPGNSGHPAILRSVRAAALKVGVAVLPVEARTEHEIETAFIDLTRQNAGAVIVATSSLFNVHRERVAKAAATRRLPSIAANQIYAEAGGLMSYGQNLADNYRRAAVFVDKILKGAKPGDLPVERPTRLELVINRKTAHALGLTIPADLLLRADKVIE